MNATGREMRRTFRKSANVEGLIRQLEKSPVSRKKLATLLAQEQSALKSSQMTYQEFLDWADEDTFAEWVNGDVIMSSPASLPQQEMVGLLYELLRSYAFFHDLGTVIQAPFQMKLEHGREPEVLFIGQEHRHRLKDTYLDGPADLVIEVISPESIGRDRGEKFYEYERHGVREYWLIDPLTQRAEFYHLTGNRYRLMPLDSDRIYRSLVLPGFWVDVEWLWQHPLPHPLTILGEIAGIHAQEVLRFMELLQGTS